MSIDYWRILEWRRVFDADAEGCSIPELRVLAREKREICDLALRHIDQMMNRNEWTQQRLAKQEMVRCHTCGWPIPCKCGPTVRSPAEIGKDIANKLAEKREPSACLSCTDPHQCLVLQRCGFKP
jgi:hypothetical protein